MHATPPHIHVVQRIIAPPPAFTVPPTQQGSMKKTAIDAKHSSSDIPNASIPPTQQQVTLGTLIKKISKRNAIHDNETSTVSPNNQESPMQTDATNVNDSGSVDNAMDVISKMEASAVAATNILSGGKVNIYNTTLPTSEIYGKNNKSEPVANNGKNSTSLKLLRDQLSKPSQIQVYHF